MIRIKFKKWRVYLYLILGPLWAALGNIDFITSGNLKEFEYIYIALGMLYLFRFLYDFKNQYLIIENQNIQKNFLYGGWNKKINLDEVILIEKSYLNYTLKTESDKLKINADLIEDDSYEVLKSILSRLDLPEGNKPALL